MNALDQPLTLAASSPAPYVHLDNRALVVHDGRTSVVFPGASFAWIAETLRVLLDEGRATRQQGAQVLGGFVAGERVTLYAGTAGGVATCDLAVADLRELQGRIGRR